MEIPTITIKIIPHKKQRYCTLGDYWQTKRGNWEVRISKSKPEYELAILLHELFEMVATKINKVDWKKIDDFDTIEGKDLEEPGDSKKAPYHKEHVQATKIEKQVLKNFGIKWEEYENSLRNK